MAIAQLIISGSSAALQIVQQYLSNPVVAGVAIECDQYREVGDDDVSMQMIMNIDNGKEWVSDNIAPKPRAWEIKGYIFSQLNIPGSDDIVIPAPFEVSALSPLLQPTLRLAVNKLRAARLSRKPVKFKTKNNEEIVQVGIVSLTFESDPSVINKVPVSMTLREIPILNSLTSLVQTGVPSGISNAAASPPSFGAVSGIPVANPVGGL